jgi:hypothetical protein
VAIALGELGLGYSADADDAIADVLPL